MSTSLPTQFAPAERATAHTLRRQSDHIRGASPLLQAIFDTVPDFLAVLNQERQIVYANERLVSFFQPDGEQPIGLRPGELLDCIHASETESGCGTTRYCGTCGAVRAVLASQAGEINSQECRIIRQNGESLDLRVWATPIHLQGEPFTIFAASDISHEKRRRALERIFFHDVLNTATGLLGWVSILNHANYEELGEFQATIRQLTERLIDEIKNQRLLAAAENSELVLQPARIQIPDLLEETAHTFYHYEMSKNRTIVLDPSTQPANLVSDPILLKRILENMLKNALEASHPGETITLGCTQRSKQVEIWVHNPNPIPDDVQLQIFQRSFSTKGDDRGLGTYSMKLLGERYLKGQVSFTSSETGTIFRILLPTQTPSF
jgi:K+-sensing histidine kinase KdpD